VTLPEGNGDPRPRLGEVARVFLKLGLIGFGGPAAHVALMRKEVVRDRGWVGEDRFLQLFGASNMVPGPSSTELGMMLGYDRAGVAGLVAAGACFIAPAMAIVLALAWVYERSGSLPLTGWVLYGVKPAILAIVVDALWQLGRRALRTWQLALATAAVAGLALLGLDPLVLLLGAALLVMLARNAARVWGGRLSGLVPAALLAATAVRGRGLTLFLTFLKIGAVVFGSGYVLLAFLRADLVERLGWLTQAQLLDAVAVGQVTPGPVFTTATFIGYLAGGLAGAALATIGIFLPAFLLAALVYRLLPRIAGSPWASAFLEGTTVAGLGLMAAVTLQLGRAAIVDPLTAIVGGATFVVLRRFEPNSAWLVLAGGLAGVAAKALTS
jgi:chromate transporter